MGTTAEKLLKIVETKEDIRTAIINKGVDVSSDTIFADYPDKISQIPTGGVAPSGRIGLSTVGDVSVTTYATAYIDVPNIANLLPENILVGNTILGVTGEAAGSTPVGTKTLTAQTDIVGGYAYATAPDGEIKVDSINVEITANPTINPVNGMITVQSTSTTPTTASIVTSGWTSDITDGVANVNVSGELQLITKSTETFIPTTSDLLIPAGRYLTGNLIVKGDPNLTSPNIISGKSVFGISGEAVVPSGNTTINASTSSSSNIPVTNYQTASISNLPSANNIRVGNTVFGVEGSLVVLKYYEGVDEPLSSLGIDGDIYFQY